VNMILEAHYGGFQGILKAADENRSNWTFVIVYFLISLSSQRVRASSLCFSQKKAVNVYG
jgi:hypothetical protein